MRVRMKTLAAGPGGIVRPGTEIDLPAPEAEALVASGQAEAVGPARGAAGRGGAAASRETAVAPPAETRAKRGGKRKGAGDDAAALPDE